MHSLFHLMCYAYTAWVLLCLAFYLRNAEAGDGYICVFGDTPQKCCCDTFKRILTIRTLFKRMYRDWCKGIQMSWRLSIGLVSKGGSCIPLARNCLVYTDKYSGSTWEQNVGNEEMAKTKVIQMFAPRFYYGSGCMICTL